MKKLKKAILILGGAAALHWLIDTLHRVATLERGFEAVGGEFMLVFLPLLVYMVYRNAKDTRQGMK